MALNRGFIGRVYPSADSVQICREKIREFATAIGDTNPISHDVSAATAAGHPDLVAPPTFAFTLTMKAMAQVMTDPALGMNFAMVVHGEQRFFMHRPIVAGDALVVSTKVADIAVKGSNEVLTTRSELYDAEGDTVAVTNEVIVSRGTAEQS